MSSMAVLMNSTETQLFCSINMYIETTAEARKKIRFTNTNARESSNTAAALYRNCVLKRRNISISICCRIVVSSYPGLKVTVAMFLVMCLNHMRISVIVHILRGIIEMAKSVGSFSTCISADSDTCFFGPDNLRDSRNIEIDTTTAFGVMKSKRRYLSWAFFKLINRYGWLSGRICVGARES